MCIFVIVLTKQSKFDLSALINFPVFGNDFLYSELDEEDAEKASNNLLNLRV